MYEVEKTVAQLKAWRKNPLQSVVQALFDEVPTLQAEGINGSTRQYFIAQLLHESSGFSRLVEGASGEAYEGRKDLGNTEPGDGKRYKGRGLIQLTGRYNYGKFGKMAGLDLVNHPELAADPRISVGIAISFWLASGAHQAAINKDFRKVTKLINGGFNGWEDRLIWLDRAGKLVYLINATAPEEDTND